jgi:hypothetical protein
MATAFSPSHQAIVFETLAGWSSARQNRSTFWLITKHSGASCLVGQEGAVTSRLCRPAQHVEGMPYGVGEVQWHDHTYATPIPFSGHNEETWPQWRRHLMKRSRFYEGRTSDTGTFSSAVDSRP